MSLHHYSWEDRLKNLYGYIVGGSDGSGRWTHFVTADAWTSLAADTTSTVAMSTSTSEGGGILLLTASNTNNNEVAVYGTNKAFLFAANQSLDFRCCMQFTELTSSAANVAMGFADAGDDGTLANLLGDNGGGPNATTASSVMLYKLDGEAFWTARMEINNTAIEEDSVVVPGGSDFKDFSIHVNCEGSNTGGQAIATFMIDGVELLDSKARKVQLRLPYASAVTMKPFLYAKTGASEQIQVKCKYLLAGQGNRAAA